MAIMPINYIELEDDTPVIAETGITVEDIVAMYVMNRSPLEWIAQEFDLTFAQIHAALSYYYDHQQVIDDSIRETERLMEQTSVSAEDVLARLRTRKATNDQQ
ncbi:MAG: DUF433 domain-containing protein [Anaerolineae bacterium]|nr:DUF433 domain-containing protein [Anaerolineae bacterium]